MVLCSDSLIMHAANEWYNAIDVYVFESTLSIHNTYLWASCPLPALLSSCE